MSVKVTQITDFDGWLLSVSVQSVDDQDTVVILEIDDDEDSYMNATISVDQWRDLVARVERDLQ
jgi:hypothetical protein